MKKIAALLLAICVVSIVTGCSSTNAGSSGSSSPASSSAPRVELTIAAASSLTNVTTDIIKDYKTVAPNVTLTFTYGASGALQTQLEQGAPVDIFMSAAEKQMDALDKEGLLASSTRTDLLENKLVLITPKGSTLGIKNFSDLGTTIVSKVAIGDPASVPAGTYAQEVFTYLKIWDAVKAKSNLGTNVSQVLTWVEGGNVDCGVVYATDAASSDKVTVVCEAPAGSLEKIMYPVAALKSSKNAQAAQSFITYLKSKSAVALFEKYGFTMA
jgi:molybdate transport system substrate-binding protein